MIERERERAMFHFEIVPVQIFESFCYFPFILCEKCGRERPWKWTGKRARKKERKSLVKLFIFEKIVIVQPMHTLKIDRNVFRMLYINELFVMQGSCKANERKWESKKKLQNFYGEETERDEQKNWRCQCIENWHCFDWLSRINKPRENKNWQQTNMSNEIWSNKRKNNDKYQITGFFPFSSLLFSSLFRMRFIQKFELQPKHWQQWFRMQKGKGSHQFWLSWFVSK